MSHSSWSQRGVDGRDKPGHDEGSVQGGPRNDRPTAVAVRANPAVVNRSGAARRLEPIAGLMDS